jgi:hypothetical protein
VLSPRLGAVACSGLVASLLAFALALPPSSLASEGPTEYDPSRLGIYLPDAPPPGECPGEPESLDSSEAEYSQEAIETRDLRIGLSRTCKALADRLDNGNLHTGWLVLEAAGGHDQRQLTNEKLQELVDLGCEGPCPVTVAEDSAVSESSGELVASIDAAGESSSAALYMLIGLVIGLPICVGIWRTVNRAL